jgi:hypothetical protein
MPIFAVQGPRLITAPTGIQIDPSTPARWSGQPADNVDLTSASFSAPAGALLVLGVMMVTANSLASGVQVADTGGLVWTRQAFDELGPNGGSGYASLWTAVAGGAAARNINVRRTVDAGSTGSGVDDLVNCKCFVVTGQHASFLGATFGGNSLSNPWNVPIFTSTADNSFAFVQSAEEQNSNNATISSDMTYDTVDPPLGFYGILTGYKALGTIGAKTVNLNNPGGGAQWNACAIEVKPA